MSDIVTNADICGAIVEDCEADAKTLDGQPFNGQTVAKRLGEIYAMIQSLAKVVERLSKHAPIGAEAEQF